MRLFSHFIIQTYLRMSNKKYHHYNFSIFTGIFVCLFVCFSFCRTFQAAYTLCNCFHCHKPINNFFSFSAYVRFNFPETVDDAQSVEMFQKYALITYWSLKTISLICQAMANPNQNDEQTTTRRKSANNHCH